MKTNRLTPLTVAIIGVVASLIAIGVIVFAAIKPTEEKIAAQQTRYDQNYPDSTPIAQRNAQNALKAATLQVQAIKYQWAQKEAALMPPLDVSDRSKALRQLTYELTHYLGPDLARQLTVGGVTSLTQLALPAPPVSPNDISAAPIVIPLGTINVNGDFRRILTHFYDWQYFNRLVLVDGLALNGNSPYMQGSYNATLFIFPQNDDKVPPPNPKAGGGGTAGAAGGGGYPGAGRAPGGYPGGGYPGGGGGYPGGYPGGRK